MARILGAALICVAATGALAGAHDLARSYSAIEVRGAEVHVTLTVDLVELFEVDADGDGQVTYDELEPAMPQVFDAVKRYFHVRGPALLLGTILERYELQRDHVLQMRIVYTFGAPVTRLELISTIHQATSGGHQHIARVRLGGVQQDVVLDQQRTTAVFDIRTRPNTPALALGAVSLATYLWVRRGFLRRR